MITCRIPLLGFALTTLAVSAGLAQPPTTASPGALADSSLAASSAQFDRYAAGASILPDWFADKNHPPDQRGAAPIRRLPQETRESTNGNNANAPATASSLSQSTRNAQPTNDIGSLFDDKLLVADRAKTETDNEAKDQKAVKPNTGRANANAAPKSSVNSAFAGILSNDSQTNDVQPALAVTAQPNAAGVNQAVAGGPVPANPLNRPKIIFQPIVGGVDSRGNALLRPDVQLAEDAVVSSDSSSVRLAQFDDDDNLPPAQFAPETAYPVGDEWMPPVVAGECGDPCSDCHSSDDVCGHIHARLHGQYRQAYPGVGREYVMHAPFFIDTTQPLNSCRIRGDAASNWEFPDRAGYFWANLQPGGKGPRPINDPVTPGETSVNYQDVVFYIERGTDRFSVATEIPIRAVDPEVRWDTTGLADMEVTSKLVFLDGCRWQLTQIMSTHIPTGSFRRGTGNGHLSLEPGVAYRWKWTDITYIHGDLTYLFPIAADPNHSGQILNYGIGISHVWLEADSWALIPTFEVDAWTVLDGRQTLPGATGATPIEHVTFEEVDSIGIVNVYPGLRWICDKGRDCGVKEFGIASGIAVTKDSWYEEIFRVEFRWSH